MKRVLVLIAVGCSRAPSPSRDAPAAAVTDAEVAVPVQTATAVTTDVPILVSGPGRTDSLEKLQIRAPFDGILQDLIVTDGDRVKANQVIGWVVSRDSEAAISGANAMLRSARSPQERADAARAVVLAKRNVVRTPLRAPESGIVLSHQVDEGANVALNEQIIVIVATDSIVFLAQIAQGDLGRVRPGSPAKIVLASGPNAPLAGTVRSILPGGSASDLTAPVRVDFDRAQLKQLNLYGSVDITVDVHRGAIVVPSTSVIRDDITGVSRVATVDSTHHAHWVDVKVGLTYGDIVELVAPPFGAGTRVVIAGLVGLPDGARVQESRASR